jgi:hypothetical protein
MTHETFGRFGILAIFDFESKRAQKLILIKKSPKNFFSQKSTYITLQTLFLILEMNFMQFG